MFSRQNTLPLGTPGRLAGVRLSGDPVESQLLTPGWERTQQVMAEVSAQWMGQSRRGATTREVALRSPGEHALLGRWSATCALSPRRAAVSRAEQSMQAGLILSGWEQTPLRGERWVQGPRGLWLELGPAARPGLNSAPGAPAVTRREASDRPPEWHELELLCAALGELGVKLELSAERARALGKTLRLAGHSSGGGGGPLLLHSELLTALTADTLLGDASGEPLGRGGWMIKGWSTLDRLSRSGQLRVSGLLLPPGDLPGTRIRGGAWTARSGSMTLRSEGGLLSLEHEVGVAAALSSSFWADLITRVLGSGHPAPDGVRWIRP